VADVLVDSVSVGAVTSYPFTNVTANHTIAASFAINIYTITASAGSNGSITPSGAVVVNSGANQTFTITPATNYHVAGVLVDGASVGAVTSYPFTNVTANHTISASFAVTNVAPVAAADDYTTHQDLAMTIDAPGVLSNDTDANSDPLTASKLSDPTHGTVTLHSDGSFTYTPSSGYKGDDAFSYRAYDGALYSSTATVTIHVSVATPPIVPSSFYGYIYISNNPPVAGDFVQAYVTGAANPVATTAITAGTLLSYSFDVPGDISGTSMVEGGTEGGVVTFKINGRVVATGIWHTGTNVQLDFTVTTHSIALVAGWNLVSFNILPTSSAITDVLATIAGNYSLVYAWNATTSSWMKYDPGVPYATTLTSLDEKMGFWIKMTMADTLDVSGSAPISTNLALKTGWNLVGYPSQTNLALPDAFSLHGVGTDFTLVYAYHASDTGDPWKKYDTSAPVYNNDLTQLAPDYGYWVKVGGAHTWDVSY
jgi:hypothetical protein